jgi:parallel beta-helix repeat protein
MNRKLIAFVLIVFIGIQSGALMVHKVKANGTIYIRADGSIDPPTAPVQRNGDTYTLTGNITGNPSGIVIERDDVILNGGGCRLQAIEGARRDPYGVGVNLLNRDNVTILNMEIKSFGFGIFLSHSNGTNISGNNITNSGYEGVYLEDSYRNIISGNSITGSDFHGLAIQASSWNSVSENNIENNGEGIALAYTGDRMGGNDISRNNVANNSGIGISVYLCLGTLSGNNITNNHVGIALWGYYVVMRNNSIVGNTYSFYIGPGPENEYWNDVDVSNTVNGKPVYYWFDEHDRQVPLDAGSVFLVNCSNITVQDLNLTNNWQGIFLVLTHDSLIAHNNFANNYYGVALLESVNNRFWGNTITDNSNGIDFSWSNSNTFYHNNFVNNTHQVSSYDGSSNGGFQDVWDDGYPSGGNYWDNYQGPDNLRGPFQNETGSDGIGDVPYVIDANNTDRYPLMPPLNLTRKTSILLNVCSVLSGSRFGIVPVRTEYTNLDDAVYPSVCIPANKSMTVSFDGWFDDYEGKSLDGKEVKLLIDDMSVSWVLSSNQSHNLNWSVAFEFQVLSPCVRQLWIQHYEGCIFIQ